MSAKQKPKNTQTKPIPAAARKLRRAASPAAASRQGTGGTTQRTNSPGAQALAAAGAQVTAIAPAPATGRIKLETSSMTHTQLNAQLQASSAGMTSTPAYAALPVTADVNTAANSMKQQLTQLASMERALKEYRLELDQWATSYSAVLNRAAAACEAADSTPATLTSGGWQLRSTPGPAQPMPAPTGLGILQGSIAGESTGKWRSVPNARYYELIAAPVTGAPLTLAEPVTITSTRTRVALPTVPPGTMITICVRAIGAKGPGPYCSALTVRVN